MRATITRLLVIMALPLFALNGVSSKVEFGIEILANGAESSFRPCMAGDVKPATAPAFSFWATLAGAPREGTGMGSAGVNIRCGLGSLPALSPAASATGHPFLLVQVSAVAGWDAGAMDPGPSNSMAFSLNITVRRLESTSAEGVPFYGNPVTDQRLVRLEPGEEFVLPLPSDPAVRKGLGVHEVMLRLHGGSIGRTGSTEYGTIAVRLAPPGSTVLLDGGVVGRVKTDGSLRISGVRVGRREVRVVGATGAWKSRFVDVSRSTTVALSPATAGDATEPRTPLVAVGRNVQGFLEYRRNRDGATMVEIPEGDFVMGNLKTEGSPLPHKVYVSTFLMDKLPVTVGLFERFAASVGRALPMEPYWGLHDDFPVAFIRWDEAGAYCEWVGGRLPTEAEREKATRGTDGRLWPWGEEPPPNPTIAVFRRNWGELGNDKVGVRPGGASPYGLLDTGGNMWEFVEDWYDPDYFKSSPARNPRGPRTGRARVVKGGSWDSRPTVLSASSRNFAYTGYREGDFGFRCAADSPALTGVHLPGRVDHPAAPVSAHGRVVK